ncbi:ab hydrolase superfamily protein c4a8.06c [Holotrichia oblita]|uniref:Ab hydrolase superfamily protein c4a8.06c n=1 Tax=Holotrichia oblita TaxID=644536 RepID=A0ACB9SYN6_HOLOL|nr:ab hydrolase superfamily protein c4a8.06c [Holotrichia oblita]
MIKHYPGYFILSVSNDTRHKIPCNLNIPYGNGDKSKLDIFGTDLPTDAPIFIFIHGGYWQEGGKDLFSYVAHSLHHNGCKTIIIGYTLCPQCTIPEIISEIQLAVKACLKYALENKSKSISIGGHSAGAHLAISLFPKFYANLTNDERQLIKSIFLISGIYNLMPLVKTTINEPLKLTENEAENLSPMFWNFKDIVNTSPKFFVITSENDSPAFIKQSELFANILKKQELRHEYILLEELDHFNIIEKMADENYDIVKSIVNSLV